MKLALLGIAGVLSLGLASSGQDQRLCSIMEENNAYIPVSADPTVGLSEQTFNEVLDRVQAKYASIVSAKGATLVIDRAWDDGTVNAYATKSGSNWLIYMFGGLARHSTITADGFILVACHELGHHLGGVPQYSSFSGMSNEGQADYYGSLKCFRQIVENDDNEVIVRSLQVPAAVQQACLTQHGNTRDQFICQRASMAGFSVASLFQALRRQSTPPDFTTPDSTTVSRTNNSHPQTQCRLDTYYQGALCNVPYSTDVGTRDVFEGTCEKQNFEPGARPRCWFSH
jgi:hypothetical protein